MPFDTTEFVGTTSEASTTSVVPIPVEMVERHKMAVLREFKRWSLVKKLDYWMGFVLWRSGGWQSLPRNRRMFSWPLAFGDGSSPPQAVYDAAAAFAKENREALFRLQVFDVDPVLEARALDVQPVFLGVWDGGRLLAVAGVNGEQPHYTPEFLRSSRRRLWDRLLGR